MLEDEARHRSSTDERQVSARDNLNTRLAHDALRVLGASGPWRASAHLYRPVRAARGVFDNTGDTDRLLWGGTSPA